MLDSRLAHVVAVSRAGSFTAGAKIAGAGQSALTKSVADLERQLGYALFHRSSRGVTVTERGREFIERTARLLDEARELLSGSSTNDPFAGYLRIGVCPASLEWRVANTMVGLMKRHPSVRFELSASSAERMLPLLRNGAVDVAIGFDAAFAEWPDVKRAPMGPLTGLLFVRNGHPLLERPSAAIAELAAYDFVSPSDSRPYGQAIRDIYESQGVDWRGHVHVVDYFPIVRRIVSESDAIGIVAPSYSSSPSFKARYTTLDHLKLFPPAPLCCAWRARWEPKAATRAFVSSIRASLAAEFSGSDAQP